MVGVEEDREKEREAGGSYAEKWPVFMRFRGREADSRTSRKFGYDQSYGPSFLVHVVAISRRYVEVYPMFIAGYSWPAIGLTIFGVGPWESALDVLVISWHSSSTGWRKERKLSVACTASQMLS